MSNSNNRRSFLQKMVALTSGAVIGAKTGFAGKSIVEEDLKVVRKVFPLGFQWQTADPFLFCVHHEDAFPKGNANQGPDPRFFEGREMGQDFIIKDGFRMYHGEKVPGFPGHPHRGFETITVVRKGMVDHSDSMGASGRYGDGDVQWMTAGRGVQHAEMFPLVKADEPNPMELFQIWLNLPKKNKFVDPHYKMLWSETIPVYTYRDVKGKKTVAEVIVGKISDHKAPTPPPNSWAADTNNDVAIWNIQMEAGATWTMPAAAPGTNRTIYFYRGQQLKLDSESVPEYHAAEVNANVELRISSGDDLSHFLVLQGKPINEPVVQHGPFVMNTREEIKQAFEDYHRTQFGGWPWKERGPVHARDAGRFAAHADGRKENRG